MTEKRPDTQSHEVNEVKAWAAGHEDLCSERYERILQELKDLKAGIIRSRREARGMKKQLRIEMKESDAVIRSRVDGHDKELQDFKLQRAYAAGAVAAAAFLGGTLGNLIIKIFQ